MTVREEEIDLRQYIDLLIKHYQLIVLGTVLTALAALAVSVLFVSPTYQATAGVLIAQTHSQVTFDPRFQTVEDDLTARYAAINQQAHRGALVALVKNGAIAMRVAEQLRDVLDEEERRPAHLLAMVSGALWENQSDTQQVSNDFIAITVRSGDPVKAAQIANAWGQVYEEYVNEVYRNRPESYTSVQEQVGEAKTTYEQAEDALTAFVATNRIDELDRLVAEKQYIIDGLQSARQTAMTTVIDEEVKAYSQIIAAYVSAQTQNQLIAFEKEQQGNRALLSSYLDAYNQGRQAVFDEQVTDRVQTLSNHYATKRKMERLLQDARALDAQVQAGGADGTTTNSLAILMLKAEAFSSSATLPGELQLQLDTAGDLDVGAVAQRADVEALIGVIENRIAELERTIEQESLALLDNEGYEYLSHSILPSDTLSTAIREQYPALFDLGDLAALTESIPPDNRLASVIAERSEALVQLKELETSLTDDAAAAPLTQVIDELGKELQSLRAELAEEQAAERELIRARDLAWETYSTLELKADELSISMGMKDMEVRFASPAVEPIKPVGRNKLFNVIVAAALGFVLSVGAVFVIHYVNPEYDPWKEMTAFLTRKR